MAARRLNFRSPTTPEPPGERRHVVVFTCTGDLQDWTVPPGVTRIGIKLWGASGGTTSAASGGGALVIHDDLPVTPGETLTILVGARGRCHPGLVRGGFGGGGDGSRHPSYAWSGSGGGRSSLLRGHDEVLVAGGGGGTGYATVTGTGGHGGAGPDGAGGDATGEGAGGGGGLTMGGAPGVGAARGNPGTRAQGGHGLHGAMQCSGGGGGGYFGGGSGGHTVHRISGAGGGGSCLLVPGARVLVARGTEAAGANDLDHDADAGRPVTGLADGKDGRVVIHW